MLPQRPAMSRRNAVPISDRLSRRWRSFAATSLAGGAFRRSESIGGERGPCRLTSATPEGGPRPRDAGRHRADCTTLIARHPAQVDERPRNSNDVRDLLPGRGSSGGGLPQPARYVRGQAQGVLLGRDVPPQQKAVKGLSRRAAGSGCSCACPPRAVVATAGTAGWLRRCRDGGVQREISFLRPSIRSNSRNCRFNGLGGLQMPERVPSQFAARTVTGRADDRRGWGPARSNSVGASARPAA